MGILILCVHSQSPHCWAARLTLGGLEANRTDPFLLIILVLPSPTSLANQEGKHHFPPLKVLK